MVQHIVVVRGKIQVHWPWFEHVDTFFTWEMYLITRGGADAGFFIRITGGWRKFSDYFTLNNVEGFLPPCQDIHGDVRMSMSSSTCTLKWWLLDGCAMHPWYWPEGFQILNDDLWSRMGHAYTSIAKRRRDKLRYFSQVERMDGVIEWGEWGRQ